jgi:hypothetical protein
LLLKQEEEKYGRPLHSLLAPSSAVPEPSGSIETMRAKLSADNTKQGGPLSKTLLDELEAQYEKMRNESSGSSSSAGKSWSNILKALAIAAN